MTAAVALIGGCALLLWLVARPPFPVPSADRPAIQAYAARPAAVATTEGVLLVASPARIAVVNNEQTPVSVLVSVTATDLCNLGPRSLSLGGTSMTLASGGTSTVSVRDVALEPSGRRTLDLAVDGAGCEPTSGVVPAAIARLDAVTAERTA